MFISGCALIGAGLLVLLVATIGLVAIFVRLQRRDKQRRTVADSSLADCRESGERS